MSTLAKVILGVVIVCVGSVVMLTVAGVFIARNVRVKEVATGKGKTVAIETPFGAMKVHENHALDPETAGIPIYPGAERDSDHGGAEFEIDAGDLHKDVTVSGASYWTNDDVDKVREFYRDKFPDWHQKWENGEFHIETKEDGRVRTIQIKRENGRTRIAVASIGPPAGN
jgi:hypothetical protein